jgi:hypothetical protein
VARRRRGRSTVLAGAVLLTAALALPAALGADRDWTAPTWRLVVIDAGGATVARAELADGRFALRYRNSVYGSLAEERFALADNGRIVLDGLAADEPAVLGEYYGARAPRRAGEGAALRWEAAPPHALVIEQLPVAATDLGERTLLVDGLPPVALWRLVDDFAPGVTLRPEWIR